MPGAGSATYLVAALASTNVVSTSGGANCNFTPGTLPNPTIDNVGIANGQYFWLNAQINQTQNGLWYADANGPVPVMTVGAGGEPLDPALEVTVEAGGAQNGGTSWVYTATSHNGGPGLVLV